MARYHDIEATIWEDIQEYSKNAKLLYVFSFSNSAVRDSGLYRMSKQTFLLNTGMNENDFILACKELEPKFYYDETEKVVFVTGKLKRRLSGLKNNKNMIKALEHDIEAFRDSFVTSLFIKKYEGALREVGISLSLPLPLPIAVSFNKDIKNKEVNKGFDVPPTNDQVFLYFNEHGALREEADNFFDHFTSNGWKVGGKTPMKNWQAAARKWMRNSKNYAKPDKTRQRREKLINEFGRIHDES